MIYIKTSCLIVSFLIFVNYLLHVYKKFGILKSISASYYRVKNRFRFFVWGITLPMFVFATNPFKPMIFVGLVFVFSVGIFANFRKRNIMYLHMIGASVGIALVILGLAIHEGIFILPVVMIIGSLIIYFATKKYVYWIEVLAFLLCIIGFALTIDFTRYTILY